MEVEERRRKIRKGREKETRGPNKRKKKSNVLENKEDIIRKENRDQGGRKKSEKGSQRSWQR